MTGAAQGKQIGEANISEQEGTSQGILVLCIASLKAPLFRSLWGRNRSRSAGVPRQSATWSQPQMLSDVSMTNKGAFWTSFFFFFVKRVGCRWLLWARWRLHLSNLDTTVAAENKNSDAGVRYTFCVVRAELYSSYRWFKSGASCMGPRRKFWIVVLFGITCQSYRSDGSPK